MSNVNIGFDEKIIGIIKFYVYALFEPESRVPFYIGKGTGNRVFSHANGVNPDIDNKEIRSTKIEKIKQIKNCKQEVRHVIVQYGLTSEEALLVESALIDMINHMLPDTLTNLVSGHGTAENFIDAEDLMRDFSAKPIVCGGDCLLLIKIEKRWTELLQQYGAASLIPQQEIYEATRASWKINVVRAGEVKYVLSVARGLVRAIYKDVVWQNCTNIPNKKMFTGSDITSESTYANKSVAHLFARGAQLPIRYICCDIDNASNED